MILLNNLYRIEKALDYSENAFTKKKYTISIDKNHCIFEGHFPGNPVLPGVCMVQIIKELIDYTTNKELVLVSADNIKFLNVVNPNNITSIDIDLQYKIEENYFVFKSSIISEDMNYFKMSGKMRDIQYI